MNILYFCQKVWLIDELNTFEHFFNKYELHNKTKIYINFIDFVISSFTFLILTLLHDWGENIVSSGGVHQTMERRNNHDPTVLT